MTIINKYFKYLYITVLLFCFPLGVDCLRAGEIHNAVAAGDLDKVRTLIKANTSLLELRDNNGNTPLNLACLHDFTRESAIAKLLIEMDANVNSKNNNGNTPLHGACSIAGSSGSDFDLVQLLVSRGAEVNAQNNYGSTPLRCGIDSLRIVRLLIENGADVNANADGLTILHFSLIYSSNMKVSKLLIESGAELNRKDNFGNTEIHLAAMSGFADVISLLVKHGADVNALNNSKHTALYYAAKHGYRNAANALIAAGADVSAVVYTNYGKAPELSANLNTGEAYLWYMKVGGYTVRTKNHFLLLSQLINFNESLEAGLVNGHINPTELINQNLVVLTSYPRTDFLDSEEGKLNRLIPNVEWVFYTSKPNEINTNIQGIPYHHLVGPNWNLSFGEISVHTTPRMPGVGFLFEVDGLKIFNGISYISNNDSSRVKEYCKGIDSLKRFGPIDIAILRVRTDGGNTYEPYLYLIDQLSPRAVFLVEGIIDPEEYKRCADFLQTRNIEIKYPETNAIAGDRFHYIRGSVKE
jgi:ankyrin repeat protein